jgi:general stress protein 26
MNTHISEALEVITLAGTVQFSTINAGGYPVTRTMFNLRNKEMFPGLADFMQATGLLYLTTNTSLAKVSDLLHNPKCSAYYFLPDAFRGVLLYGTAEIVTDRAVKEALWQKGWEMYYPLGVTDPEYTVMALKPVSVKGYRQLTHYTIGEREWSEK